MPMTQDFKTRLSAILPDVVQHFGTPFHIYDERGIRATAQALTAAFAPLKSFGADFREYFAVKALPNPHILALLRDEGFGFDCSSMAELILSRQVGARGDDIMFTSNNTSTAEFAAALADGGSILNLDDETLVDNVPHMPDTICFRYNPGAQRSGNVIIGKPEEAKYGLMRSQLMPAYERARQRGAIRFGLHTMIASNERDATYFVQTVQMLLDIVTELAQQGIELAFINMGGGMGIPYHPDEKPLDLSAMASGILHLMRTFADQHGYLPHLYMENGRYITGPHGVLVTRAINRKRIYRHYIGVDASMSALMRPGMYGAYHHVHVWGKEDIAVHEVVDITGSLCENNDKFAVQRALPPIAVSEQDGDLLIIHDTGAHGHAMGFNYNGKLRPQELLLRADGSVQRIRRAETLDDYFATLQCDAPLFTPQTTISAGGER